MAAVVWIQAAQRGCRVHSIKRMVKVTRCRRMATQKSAKTKTKSQKLYHPSNKMPKMNIKTNKQYVTKSTFCCSSTGFFKIESAKRKHLSLVDTATIVTKCCILGAAQCVRLATRSTLPLRFFRCRCHLFVCQQRHLLLGRCISFGLVISGPIQNYEQTVACICSKYPFAQWHYTCNRARWNTRMHSPNASDCDRKIRLST